jgi:hypothetical protein
LQPATRCDAGQVIIAEPFPDATHFSEEFWLKRTRTPDEARECVTSNIAAMTGVLSRPGKCQRS